MREGGKIHPARAVAELMERRRQAHLDFLSGMTHPAWCTLALIALFAGVWWLEVSTGTHRSLFNLARSGGRLSHLVWSGELWRLFVAPFLHSNFQHFAGNALVLLGVGWLAEHVYGSKRFLILFLASAIGGGLAGALYDPRMSVGASGAIFGIWAADLVFAHRNWYELPRRFRATTGWLLLLVFLYFLIRGLFLQDVDNAAHVGGALTGAFTALWIESPRLRNSGDRHGALSGIALAILLLLLIFSSAIALQRARYSSHTRVAQLEGKLVSFRDKGMAIDLKHPVSWRIRPDEEKIIFESPVSGVRLLIVPDPEYTGMSDWFQSDPLRNLDQTLLRTAAIWSEIEGEGLDLTFDRRTVAGYPARVVKVVSKKPEQSGNVMGCAVWSEASKRVVLLIFTAPPRLPEQYQELFESILDTVELDDPE